MGLFSFLGTLFGKSSATSASSKKSVQEPSLRNLEDFVMYVSKLLVDHPDDVDVKTVASENGKVIQIACRADDRGKIIGKRGKTIIALRALVSGAAGRIKDRVSVEVLDEEDRVKA